MVIMIELFCTLLVVSFVWFAKQQTKMLAGMYNRNNVKPNDYTMFISLSSSQIKEFDEKIYDRNKDNSSRGIQLVAWLRHQLEEAHKNVNARAPRDTSSMRGTYGGLKIARMDLLFDNAKMIDLLLKRGKAVKRRENDQIIEVEAEIHAQIDE